MARTPFTAGERPHRHGEIDLGAFALMALLFVAPVPALAQTTPASGPSPTPAAQVAAPQPIPKTFDPCGGPLELLNKLGNGTACVFVAGEAAITAQYASANIPVNSRISFNTAMGSSTLGFSGAERGFGYPGSVVYIGVLPRAQIAITPPSFVQVNGSTSLALAGSEVLTAGASDMKFEYKQLAYVDPSMFTMLAIDLAYDAPTGSPALRAAGPQYTINPIVTLSLPHNFGVTLAFPVNNFATTSAPVQRGWSFTPQIVPYWQSPGGTLLSVFVQHNFYPNVTPVGFSATQLIGRHLAISVTEGGFSYTTSASGPLGGLVTASSTAYPNLFSVGITYLFGHSDLPAPLQQ